MSEHLKQFLHEQGVFISKIIPYNPQGNGQCEMYNGIICKTIVSVAANHRCLVDH